MMKKVLITGGNGDISKAIIRKLETYDKFKICAPGREELDVTSVDSVISYIDEFLLTY